MLIDALKEAKRHPDFLYEDEMADLLDSIDESSALGKRNKALLELFYARGLRCSEAVNLKIEDIDFSKQILIVHGKGKKDRYIPFHDYASDCLKDYIDNYRLEIIGLDKDDQIIGYKYVHLGKMMDNIKKGIDPMEAIEKASGTYGRFDEAVKKIDPRKQ